jgi:hypothetical protein
VDEVGAQGSLREDRCTPGIALRVSIEGHLLVDGLVPAVLAGPPEEAAVPVLLELGAADAAVPVAGEEEVAARGVVDAVLPDHVAVLLGVDGADEVDRGAIGRPRTRELNVLARAQTFDGSMLKNRRPEDVERAVLV